MTAYMTEAVLNDWGENLAAGYMENGSGSPIRRMARGLRRHFERSPQPAWNGEPLYPTGATALPLQSKLVTFSYWSSLNVDREQLDQSMRAAHGAADGAADGAAHNGNGEALSALERELRDLYRVGSSVPNGYNLGGGGYTHSIIHFGRVLREGLAGYGERLEHYTGATSDPARLDFYSAMRDVLAGLNALVERIKTLIAETMARQPNLKTSGERLLAALDQAPLNPARNFYEAMVATNLLWYVDGSDNLGRFDQDLGPYLKDEDASEALELVKLLWRNVDACCGWNVALGGSTADGQPAYNALTELCLEAAVGRRRPNLALRVRRDMPDSVFDRALDAIASGCGLPALYNEEGYLAGLRDIYGDMGSDACQFAFGGCTETMVHGRSNVGSIDGGINLLGVLDRTLRERLESAPDFDAFLAAFFADVRATLAAVAECVNEDQCRKAREQPQPLRSLLIDDCLERGVEFNAGGARYNSGVINIGGLANVADSLTAIRDLVFGGRLSAQQMLEAMQADYQNHEDIRLMVKACPKFGNDDDRVDALASQVAAFTFGEVKRHRTWRGNTPFEPACIMFATYAGAGESVGATPDGRHNAEPVADSIGPMQGRDTHGPTAMLRSVCKLPLRDAVGTPILNIRLGKDVLKTEIGREKVKALIRACFALGGMQIQATVVDQEVLRDAIAHPERHADLIVRIGGYSEYFNNLSEALKLSVLERTEHS